MIHILIFNVLPISLGILVLAMGARLPGAISTDMARESVLESHLGKSARAIAREHRQRVPQRARRLTGVSPAVTIGRCLASMAT